jgi:hypothetical protein
MANQQQNTIDPKSVIADYFKYVRQYRNASAVLENAENTLWPTQQVRGLLIELALKTYLCTTGHVAWGHDLEKLTCEAEEKGLVLTEDDHTSIICKINEIYFRGKAWDADYICRYPMPNRGLMITITPSHNLLEEMIERIVNQAINRRNKSLLR